MSDKHNHAHSHSHDHDHNCCGHDHGHSHLPKADLGKRWITTAIFIVVLLVLMRPFILSQMLVRVTSYSANASYHDAVRMCQKVIILDRNNIQAWTALGYAYMDLGETAAAIGAFEQVLTLNPQDKGAACFELGQAYYAKGDYAKAIDYFERVRNAGPQAAQLLDADVLKYRHGTMGLRSVHSMDALLGLLADAYRKSGDTSKADQIQKEYEASKTKHSKILF